MSDTNGTDSDVIRRQQEHDLGHKLEHGSDGHGGPPKEFLKPETLRKPNRTPVEKLEPGSG